MRKTSRFWGLHAEPSQRLNLVLFVLPFLLLSAVYFQTSYLRLQENPSDKFFPSFTQMVSGMGRMAFTKDQRTGNYLLWHDTLVSFRRLGIGMTLAAGTGLFLGLNMGRFPGMRALFLPFVTFTSNVPPLAILPILLVAFGVDELAKVMLIFIGTFLTISRDIYLAVEKIPREQVTKALTLGASTLGVVYRVTLPQIMPRLIDATRISLGAALLYLIAAEAIAATDGLGYRIFLVRRYLAMDIIIPYVLWITCCAFAMDWCLRKLVSWKYFWYLAEKV